MAKKTAEATTVEWDQIEIGDQVKHPKWGVGTVLFRSGNGDKSKAIVVFPEEGQKKLMLKFAKLKKVGSTSIKSVEKLKAESNGKPAKPAPSKNMDEDEADLDLGAVDKDDDEDDELLGDDEVAGFDDDDEEDEIATRSKGKGDTGNDDE